ncbi:MAG: hypothetical protein EBU49_13325, partial [Proteobacteria bacterium]|nr:hypothetical protein [Pseudomonadota bacterium]
MCCAAILVCAVGLARCSSSGNDTENRIPLKNITGSIKSSTGRQSDMVNWTLLTLEKTTQIARSAVINISGTFSIENIREDREHTIILLSPDHLLRSILSIPTTSTTVINQFFTGTPDQLPPLVERGPIVIFGSLDGIIPVDEAVNSDRGDGIPNAAYGDHGYGLIDTGSGSNFDLRGLPESFNPDRNANGVLDVFEADINQNKKIDTAEGFGPNFFDEGLEYAALQYELSTNSSGAETAQIIFSAKLKPDSIAQDVKIIGSSNIINGATTTSSGNTVAWDQTLLDDGASDDSLAGDRIFGRRITLGSASRLKSFEVVLFEPRRSDAETAPTSSPVSGAKYPVTAPPLTLSALSTPVWDSVTRTINRVGNP